MATPTVIDPKQLGQTQPTTTANTTLYTVPSGKIACIQTIDICNTTASAAVIRIFLVPPSGSAGVTNAIMYDLSIAANATVTWTGPQYLHYSGGSAGTIVVQCGTANAVTFTVSGLELS